MSKQTAVEWFFEQLTTVDYNCINKTFLQNDNSLEGHNMRKLFYQAKEMEKEQRIDDIVQFGIKYEHKYSQMEIIKLCESAEKYYNETYKKEEK